MSKLPSDGIELSHHSLSSSLLAHDRCVITSEVREGGFVDYGQEVHRPWNTYMTHDDFRSERRSIPRLLGCGSVYVLIALSGCSRPPNEELSPLPPSVTAHASSDAPAPKPVPKRYPPPVLVDQSIGVVVDDKSVSTLCRRAMTEQIRYECRIPEQTVPENVGFPAKADQVIICLGRVNDQGYYVSVSTARSKLQRTPRGTYQAGVQLKIPPKPTNRPPATTGWTLRVKALRAKSGLGLVFEQPVSLE